VRLHSIVRRRPSPAIVISSVALFLSLGGVGYAATQLPSNSVGSSQIRNEAVTYKKIRPGAVGIVRANLGQLQERVSGTCSSNNAIASIDQSGKVACNSTLPAETGTTSNTAAIPTTATSPTSVTSTTLTSGATYLGLANPTVTVTPGTGASPNTAETASVTCTLTVGSNTTTRTVTVTTPSGTEPASESLPLQLTGTGGTAGVSCKSASTDTPTPGVSVTSAVNAIQIH
jgi:hypothetical protein